MRIGTITCLVGLLTAAGCAEQTSALPDPVTLTDDAIGHYDKMIVVGHRGPKAQVHLAGAKEPLWFTQVRDAFAFERGDEKDAEITAIYVNDMGSAPTWDDPGHDNWLAAETAFFVVGSDKRGGMGAPELVPFADKSTAASFAELHGGNVIAYQDIEDAMVLGPVDVELDMPGATQADGHEAAMESHQ
jgi:copper chaperone NosL